jgi:hypothetical protein
MVPSRRDKKAEAVGCWISLEIQTAGAEKV